MQWAPRGRKVSGAFYLHQNEMKALGVSTMKRIIAGVALALCGVAAHAQIAGAGAEAGSNSNAGANAGSSSGSSATIVMPTNPDHIWTYGNQTVTTQGTQTVNSNSNVSGTTTLKNVPNIGMSGPASGPCTGPSGGVTVAVPGAGVGINGASTEGDCQKRELARICAMIGDADCVKETLFFTDAAADVRKRKADYQAQQAQPKAAAAGAPATTLVAARPSDSELCMQARAKDDKPLAMRVCR